MLKVFSHSVLHIILLLVFTEFSSAQYFVGGNEPSSQRWRQIHSNSFRLIYPVTWENKAQELANYLESIKHPVNNTLHSEPSAIPVILHNQSMLSNGFVMWAPKRIEMVTTIPYDNMATDWMKHLALHEYRHVVQIEAINRSTTGFFSGIFGQHITGSVAGLHLPLWFLEGDAVLIETAMSGTGRGRIPSFTMPLTAQLLEKGTYSYDKAMMGSYRDMIPDHYTLGYHLVAKTQSQYGFEPFLQSLYAVARTPFLPASFSRGLKKTTGMNVAGLYRATMSKLEEEWKAQNHQSLVSDFKRIDTNKNSDYADYINPHYIDDTTFIAFRTSPADIPRLVLIGRNGSEKTIFTPGYGFYDFLSYSNGIAAWAEITTDPRWEYRNWSNIRIFELETRKSRLITHTSRLQSPMLSPDGSQIAAIEVTDQNNWALVILNTKDGKELFRITDPGIDFLSEPSWSDCSQAIIAIAFTEGLGKTIVKTNILQPGFEPLFDAGYSEISEPAISECIVYFTGTWSGRNELYAWHIEEKQLYHLLSSEFGATCTAFSDDKSKILFSEYTAEGYKIAECSSVQKIPVDLKDLINSLLPLYEPASQSIQVNIDSLPETLTRYEPEEYKKALNSLNFHSWIPVSLDVEEISSQPGITAFSQNLLGTTIMAIGYEYNSRERGNKAFMDLILQAWYPVFDFRFELGREDRLYKNGDAVVKFKTDFAKVDAGVSLPLSYNHNAWIYGLIPRVSTSQELYCNQRSGQYFTEGLRSLSYSLSLYTYRRMALRDLYPRLGVSTASGFSHTPFSYVGSFTDRNAGEIMFGAVSVFFPGALKHHSFRIYAGFQDRNIKYAYFGDKIRLARGYSEELNEQMVTLSASYSFPFSYPDIAAGSIIYIKRLKANIFADHSSVHYQRNKRSLNSYGIDIVADAHLLRMPMPYELGLRTMFTGSNRKFAFEFIWSVDFYAVGQAFRKGRNVVPGY